MTTSTIPDSITFSDKTLRIPSLEEVGIPIAGLSIVNVSPALKDFKYSGGCWINRGEKLLTYTFNFFAKDKPSFFDKLRLSDPTWSFTYEILSPISGLLLGTREEDTIDNSLGLQYQWCKERALPIILIPNDEPLPDKGNFYEYNNMTPVIREYFYRLPIRDHARESPERLSDYCERFDCRERFEEIYRSLETRQADAFSEYDIRSLNIDDSELIDNIDSLRAKDLILREKLLSLSRKFGKTVS